MSDQLLKRVKVAPNQRTDVMDMLRTNDFALTNLGLMARYFLAPSIGIVRGLLLCATDPASMLCSLSPGAAVGENGGGIGAIIVESERSVGPFAANSSGNPRIDLVSIRYAEADQSPGESRPFVNPADNSTFFSTTATWTQANPVVTVTQGVPAISPLGPATPAGDIAVAQVRVASGATSIAASDITQVDASRVGPLKVGTFDGAGNIAIPYTSPTVLTLDTPPGHVSVLTGWFDVNPGSLNYSQAFFGYIYDATNGIVHRRTYNSLNQGSPGIQRSQTYQCLAVVGPTAGTRDYQFKFGRADNISASTDATFSSAVMVAQTLPAVLTSVPGFNL